MKEKAKIKNFPMDYEQMFHLLCEASLDGIIVGFSDGTITAANPAACRMLGRSEAELRHIGSRVLFDQDEPQLVLFWEEQARTAGVKGEFLLRRADGAKFSAALSSSECQDSTGRKMTILIIRDITERKRADEALRKANQKIDTILASITDFYFAWDRESRFTDLNQQAAIVMGKERDAVIGRRLFELFPQTKKENVRFYNTAMASQTPMYFEALFLFGRWFEARAYPSEEGLSVYFRDITERKRAEKKLQLKTENLEEVNAALKVLLKQLEEGKADVEGKIMSNIRELVLPNVDKLKNSNLSPRQLSLLNIVETNLNNIASSFLPLLKLKHYNLTPREIEVATLVREGRSLKNIAELLSISISTVQFHRVSLRGKLGLKKRSANLRSYLLSLQ